MWLPSCGMQLRWVHRNWNFIHNNHEWNYVNEIYLCLIIMVNITITVCWNLILTFDAIYIEIVLLRLFALVPSVQFRQASYCLILYVGPVHWSHFIISATGAGDVITGIVLFFQTACLLTALLKNAFWTVLARQHHAAWLDYFTFHKLGTGGVCAQRKIYIRLILIIANCDHHVYEG